jgi:RNA polymerase sigma factor (sigma-70 family)
MTRAAGVQFGRGLSPTLEALSDKDLLERFTTQGDGAALEALVQRHGPMVLSACGRILHDGHDRNDAFQATFLVLVRKAASIKNSEALAGWLYRVAVHVALEARAKMARQTAVERKVVPEATGEDLTTEAVDRRILATVLDEELAKLPSTKRDPLVLVHLQGYTCKEAADKLGVPEGTLKSRMRDAYALLRPRLVRRGVALASTLPVLEALSQSAAQASVPTTLSEATVLAAMQYAGAKPTTAAASAQAVELAESVLRGSTVWAGRKVAEILAVVVILAMGSGLLYHYGQQRETKQPVYSRIVTPASGEEVKRGFNASGSVGNETQMSVWLATRVGGKYYLKHDLTSARGEQWEKVVNESSPTFDLVLLALPPEGNRRAQEYMRNERFPGLSKEDLGAIQICEVTGLMIKEVR